MPPSVVKMTGSESHATVSPCRTLLRPINVALTIRARVRWGLLMWGVSFSNSIARLLPDDSFWLLIYAAGSSVTIDK
jgi:hypothetical protein